MCVFCGSPAPIHLAWVPLAIGAFGYIQGRRAIRRAERRRAHEADVESARSAEPVAGSPERPPADPATTR